MPKKLSYPTLIFIFLASIFVGSSIAYILIDITQKQTQAKIRYYQVAPFDELEDRIEIWGQNHPFQFESFIKTLIQTPTLYGGSIAVSRSPSDDDPRTTTSRSKLELDPRLKIIWAGYPFGVDTREKRGHAYMLVDQKYTQRQKVAQQFGACLNCHASTYKTMMELGEGNLEQGFHQLNKMPYQEAAHHVTHALSCIDCHDSQTMALRITRPAFKKGIALLKASQGVHQYDVNRDATHQEMRSFVCAQCHVNYHLDPKSKELTYPWSEGIKVEEILVHYNKKPHTDWVHPQTGASLMKAQHPEFELFSQGTHAKAGVSCVDCHMPYERQGAHKVTNHHIRSPLLNAQKACMTCHSGEVDQLISRVHDIQHAHHEMLDTALNALVDFIKYIEEKRSEGLATEKLKDLQSAHYQAQFIIDFVEAENSNGFHAPLEASRLLMKSMEIMRQAQKKH